MFIFENELQQDIRNSVRALASREVPRFQSKPGELPRELFSLFAKQGLTALVLDEQYGGIAEGALTSSIVMEELAAVDLGPAIFLSVHLMVAGIIQRHGSPAIKQRYLPRLASGELLAAFALTEPQAGSDASAISTTAVKSGEHYVINGEKCYITSAGFADLYLVFAKDGDPRSSTASAFLLERSTPGLKAAPPEAKMGCELSPIASLYFDGVKAQESQLLGAPGKGLPIAFSGLNGGRINIAACANGISRSALQAALNFTAERKQFGKVLHEFQGLEFMLADMKIALEAAQLAVWQAASAQDGSVRFEDRDTAASVAKCLATDTAMRITTDAVQLFGGAGYLKSYPVERLMREAKMLQIVEGTNQIQRLIIARELKKKGRIDNG